VRAVDGTGECAGADAVVGVGVGAEPALAVEPLLDLVVVDDAAPLYLDFVHVELLGLEGLFGDGQGEVGDEVHRCLVRLGEIKRLDGLVEALGDGGGGDDEAGDFAVTAVQQHIKVALFLLGGHPRRGTGAHHVGDHERCLAGGDEAEGLAHEVDAGARGGGHGAGAAPCGTQREVDRREFVLGLDDGAAVSFDATFQVLHHVRRGGDGVAGVEPAASGECAHADGLVAVEQHVIGVGPFEVVLVAAVGDAVVDVGVRLADVLGAQPCGLAVAIDDLFALVAEALLQGLVETVEREVGDRGGGTERDDVAHDSATGLLGEAFQRDVDTDDLLGHVGLPGALAVVDDDRPLVKHVGVLVDSSLC
jgi:hypothetical protein